MWHDFHLRISGLVFDRRNRYRAEIFHLEMANKVTARVIFPGGQIFALVLLAIPLCYERVCADCELIQFSFLMQNAHQLPISIVNTEGDRSLKWRRNKT